MVWGAVGRRGRGVGDHWLDTTLVVAGRKRQGVEVCDGDAAARAAACPPPPSTPLLPPTPQPKRLHAIYGDTTTAM